MTITTMTLSALRIVKIHGWGWVWRKVKCAQTQGKDPQSVSDPDGVTAKTGSPHPMDRKLMQLAGLDSRGLSRLDSAPSGW